MVTARWILGIVAIAAILVLLLFARGAPDRGDAEPTPTAAAAELAA